MVKSCDHLGPIFQFNCHTLAKAITIVPYDLFYKAECKVKTTLVTKMGHNGHKWPVWQYEILLRVLALKTKYLGHLLPLWLFVTSCDSFSWALLYSTFSSSLYMGIPCQLIKKGEVWWFFKLMGKWPIECTNLKKSYCMLGTAWYSVTPETKSLL